MAEKLTKKELKEQRRLERLAQEANPQNNSGNIMKWGVLALVIVVFVGLFGFVIYRQKQENYRLENLPKNFTSAGWVRGDSKAPNTLVEFADFQCPHCKENEPYVEQLLDKYKGKLKLQYKYFPLSFKYSSTTARAAEAAGKQGKFWEMHDILFDKQTEIAGASNARELINQYAESLKLDMDKFTKDFESKEVEQAIDAQKDEGVKVGVNGTPTFFINGKFIPLQASFEAYDEAISKEFKK